MIVGVTGHRPHKLAGYDQTDPFYHRLSEQLRQELVSARATRGVTGMALGADTIFAQTCIHLGLPFTAAVPFQGQESQWPTSSQQLYQSLLDQAADVVYVNEPGYARWKMQARNEWIVVHSDLLLAVWDGSPGGTANTVLCANRRGRAVRLINPRELHVGGETDHVLQR